MKPAPDLPVQDDSRPAAGAPSLARDRARGYRRTLRAGLLASVLIHALAAIFIAGQLSIGTRSFRPVELPPRPPAGMQVVEVQEIESESAAEEVLELPLEEPDEIDRPEPPIRDDATGQPGRAEETGPGMTNAERLQPREGDPRLWQDFGDQPLPEYLEDRWALAEGVIRARLGAMLDSLQLTEEQRRRAVEWLFGEGDQQWGVSEDGLVLGGTVIPMNVGALFQAEGPLGRELRQEAGDLADIQRQDMQTEVERSQRERLEEMRRRSEEEAERRRRDTASAEADTTDSGRRDPRD